VDELEVDNEGSFDRMSIGLGHTTMSFDVEADSASEVGSAIANGALRLTPVSPKYSPMREKRQWQRRQSPIRESDLEGHEGPEGGEHAVVDNAGSFSVYESREFLLAMGGSVSAASLATNHVRTGDSFCAGETTDDLDRAVHIYYAGLGAILNRVKEWSLERIGNPTINDDDDAENEASMVEGVAAQAPDVGGDASRTLSHEDFLEVARCPETNILLLAISSILLRAGNAHFRLRQYENACRDYASAQSYRMLRHEARGVIEKERTEIQVEDAKLNGRISNNMASSQSKRGLYDEARSEYTKALQIKQGTLEALHKAGSSGNGTKKDVDKKLVSDIASTFHNIGLMRMNCGEPQKAEKAYKQSLSLRVKKFGLDDLGVSSSLCALGDLYYHKKQYDDAFRSYKESLRIWKLHFPKSDLKTAEHYYNIGLVFYSKGPYIKAKSAVAECLRIRRQQLISNKRLPVASALYLLGLVATSLGNYDEALSLLQESLAIRQQFLPRCDHLLLLNVHLALGIVHQKMNDFDKAMDCFSVALAGRSRRLGKDHGSVSEVLQAIGVTYTEANEYHKALKTLEEALQIRRTYFGSSLEVADTLNSLSLVFFKSGDTSKASELSEEALDVLKDSVEFDHILVGKVLKNVGDYYQNIEAYDDAMAAYSESLRVITAFYGKEHVYLSEVLNEIGVTQFKNGNYMLAKQSFTEVGCECPFPHCRLTLFVTHQCTPNFPHLRHYG
jgi:tetratricopeptide (TPR) repeat protein